MINFIEKKSHLDFQNTMKSLFEEATLKPKHGECTGRRTEDTSIVGPDNSVSEG